MKITQINRALLNLFLNVEPCSWKAEILPAVPILLLSYLKSNSYFANMIEAEFFVCPKLYFRIVV